MWGVSVSADEEEVAGMLEQADRMCHDLEEHCMEPLKAKDALRLVAFTRSIASKLTEDRTLRSDIQRGLSEKYQKMKNETLENSLRIIQDVQVGHKEAQGVLLHRIASLEASLNAAQEAYGEAVMLKVALKDRESECIDLRGAVEELEEEMRREMEGRDRNLSTVQDMLDAAEAKLVAKDLLLKDLQDALAAVTAEGQGAKLCTKCEGELETQKIFSEFGGAMSGSFQRAASRVAQPMKQISSVEELIMAGAKWYTGTVSWGLKRMGV